MKGASSSRAGGAKMENPVNINTYMRGEVMNKITTVALPGTTVIGIGIDLGGQDLPFPAMEEGGLRLTD